MEQLPYGEMEAVRINDGGRGFESRVAADKAASLERWKSFCRQLPDSDG